MKTRHDRRADLVAAELLLDGDGDPADARLSRVLAAAGAPARPGELAGEPMAIAAFEASHLVPAAPSAATGRARKSVLGKLLTVKVVATTLAALATGGVALAASNAAFIGSARPTAAPTSPAGIASSAPAGTLPSTQSSLRPGATSAPRPPASSVATPLPSTPITSTLPRSAAALCKTLAGDAVSAAGTTLSPSGLVRALSATSVARTLSHDSGQFAALVATAQSAANVPDYCALVLRLPQLPDPGQLGRLPSALLGKLLTALPTSTLTRILTSLPSSTLSQVLTAVPASALSGIFASLPSSVVGQLLQEVPSSTISQLPQSVLSQLPSSVLGLL